MMTTPDSAAKGMGSPLTDASIGAYTVGVAMLVRPPERADPALSRSR